MKYLIIFSGVLLAGIEHGVGWLVPTLFALEPPSLIEINNLSATKTPAPPPPHREICSVPLSILGPCSDTMLKAKAILISTLMY